MLTIYVKNGTEKKAIHNPSLDIFAFNKQLSEKLNTSKTLKFSVDNTFDKSLIKYRTTDILVYDDEKLIFKGYSITSNKDFYNTGTVECEGVFSFMNDTFFPPFNHQGSHKDLFEDVIENHNNAVEDRKKFTLGEFNVVDTNNYIARSSEDYLSTKDILKDKFVNRLGGFLRVSYTEDTNIISYLASIGKQSNQTIETAKNLLDIEVIEDTSSIITVLIPLGHKDMDTGTYLDIKTVNSGLNFIENTDAIEKYGRIYGIAKWDDVTVAENLKTKAQQYLLDHSNPRLTIKLKAVDLHMVDKLEDAFELGNWIKCIIPTHDIDDYFQLSEINHDLDDPANSEITLGNIEQSFSETTRNEVQIVTDAVNQYVNQLVATNIKVTGKLETDVFEAVIADMDKAIVDDFLAVYAEINTINATIIDSETGTFKFANVDFSNIGEAAVQKLFLESGMIDELVMSDGKVTGKLVGVTIIGDLIEAGTLKADKLVIKGTDGLLYKINADALGTTVENIPDDQLHGSVIVANSITAEKIDVDDLIAFGATIGGFNIGQNSLYSGVKSSVDNTAGGVYFDCEGQVNFGDEKEFIKLYIDEAGNYRLLISASAIQFSATGDSVESVISDLKNNVDENYAESQATASDLANLTDVYNSFVNQTNANFNITLEDAKTYTDQTTEESRRLVSYFNMMNLGLEIRSTDSSRPEISRISSLIAADSFNIIYDRQYDKPIAKFGIDGTETAKLILENTLYMPPFSIDKYTDRNGGWLVTWGGF